MFKISSQNTFPYVKPTCEHILRCHFYTLTFCTFERQREREKVYVYVCELMYVCV